jgi:predicted TIM-barrel fold metal-dependent hydrolase
MYLRWADRLIEEDRITLRDFVEKWSERILFGTDSGLRPAGSDNMDVQGFLCHARFILALGLNDKALQDVAWRNAKNLLGLKDVSTARSKSVRP